MMPYLEAYQIKAYVNEVMEKIKDSEEFFLTYLSHEKESQKEGELTTRPHSMLVARC